MNPILNIAVRATRQAGGLIAQAYEQRERVEVDQQEPYNGADAIKRAAEHAMVGVIHKAYPHHIIFSATTDLLTLRDNEAVHWIIDPVAGATNFTKRLPHFAISVAVVIKGHTEVVVLYDILRNELFTAVRGCGAQMNGYRLRSGGGSGMIAKDLRGSVLATGLLTKAGNQIAVKMFNVLLQRGVDFRRSGCVALDLAYVAAGRLDGFFAMASKHWDFAAGALLVREAGGLVTDFGGSPDHSITDDLVAGPAKAVKELLAIARSAPDVPILAG